MHRWVARPLLELAYVALSAYVGIVTFTVTITTLAVSIGLLPAFLIGLPLLVATVYLVHGMAVMERGRAAVFLDVDLPSRGLPRRPGRGKVVSALSLLRAPEFWKETSYCLALLPVGMVASALSVSFYAAALAGLLLPVYIGALPGDQGVTWLHLPVGLEATLGVLAGALCLLIAWLLTAAFATAQVSMARALLAPSENDALRGEVRNLRDSRARVVDAADAERRRIERDLHDGAQQHLVALAMNLGRAKAKLDDDPEAAKALVTEAHQAAKDSITELRNVIRGVHPAVLTDRGLDAALSGLAARSPVPVRLDVDVPRRPSPTIEAVAYFVVSEALTNVTRHSRATRATVHVERAGDRLLLSVVDDGVGGASDSPGSGLAGLRDRVHAVDGTFHLQSPPGGGTTVTVELPCES